jgi:O-antigen/teichoic acid export membrane protein
LVLTRLYAPAEFGQYASILALASVLGALITMSYQTAIPLAEDDEESRVVAWLAVTTASLAAAGITVVLAGSVVAGVEVLGWQPSWQHVLFVPITSLTIAVWGTLQYRQSRLSAFHRVALATGTGAATQVGSQIALGWLGAGAAGLSGGYLVGRLMNLAVLLRGAHLGRLPKWRSLLRSGARWSQMPRWQLPTTVLNLMATSALAPWVALQYGLASAGSFAFALQMLSVPAALVGQAITMILFPKLAEAERVSGIRPDRMDEYVRRLSSVAFPVFLPVLVLGPALFAVVFGSEWTEAGAIASILSPYLAVSLVSSSLSSVPVVKHRFGTILGWATLDTSARFAAIALGNVISSAQLGFALYSAVGTLSAGMYLAWTLHLSGASPFSPLRNCWPALPLAVGSIVILLTSRQLASLEVVVVITVVLTSVWAWVAVRGLMQRGPA